MPRLPIDYSKTIIYKLVCRDINIKEIYVGATTNWVNRKGTHKNNCNYEKFKVYQYIRDNGGWNNFIMVMIEKYPCETSQESAKRERYWTETLGATLNSNVQGRTDKEYRETHKEEAAEYQAVYYQQNKEQLSEYKADYYQQNKEQILEYQEVYRETHKEEAAEYKAVYYQQNKEQIAKQSTEYRETHKEEVAEYQAVYYQQNKEQIVEYKADYYQQNKEQISKKRKDKYTCKCGLIICNSSKSKHNKTIKHINFISSERITLN
jgi:hypothetical protein